ncbi:nitrate/nitrite transporter NrtS [Pseudoalteromonas sp. MBR-15]|jgi:hypothetical protein
MKVLFVILFRPHIVKNAIKIASVVGTLLNIANQGSEVLSGADISWVQALLNYCIPYFVASYSAARNEIERKKADGNNR